MDIIKNKKVQVLLGILLFIACAIPLSWVAIFSSGFKIANVTSSNPTPFQPFQYTQAVRQQRPPILNTLVPNEGLIPPEGQINVLMLGSDWRPGGGFRTDVLLLMSIYTIEGKVKMLSFPRDLWVEQPGSEENRINTAMGVGGFPLVTATFERNFAIPVDFYIMTNFSGFKSIVDAMGGIEINTPKTTSDSCDISYLDNKWCSVGPGTVQLDGEMALWYVRSRYTTSDFDRTRRAQEVAEGFFRKLMSLNAISRAPEIYNLFIDSVETNLSLDAILSLLKVAPEILADSSRVERYAIGLEHVTPTMTDAGASILIPDYPAIWDIVVKTVYSP